MSIVAAQIRDEFHHAGKAVVHAAAAPRRRQLRSGLSASVAGPAAASVAHERRATAEGTGGASIVPREGGSGRRTRRQTRSVGRAVQRLLGAHLRRTRTPSPIPTSRRQWSGFPHGRCPLTVSSQPASAARDIGANLMPASLASRLERAREPQHVRGRPALAPEATRAVGRETAARQAIDQVLETGPAQSRAMRSVSPRLRTVRSPARRRKSAPREVREERVALDTVLHCASTVAAA